MTPPDPAASTPSPGAPARRRARKGEPGPVARAAGPGGNPSSPPPDPGTVVRNASPVPGTRSSSRAVAGNRAEAEQTPAGASLMAHGSPPAGPRITAGPSLADLRAAAMTENELEEHIRWLCKGLGITRIHVRNSRGTTPGVPDDILIGPRGVLWRELKTMRGKLTPAQRAMGEALLAAGQDWAVWRPDSVASGAVARELAALAGLRGAA